MSSGAQHGFPGVCGEDRGHEGHGKPASVITESLERLHGPFRPTLDCRRHVRARDRFAVVLLEPNLPHAVHLLNLSVGGGLLHGMPDIDLVGRLRLALLAPNGSPVVVRGEPLHDVRRDADTLPIRFSGLSRWGRRQIEQIIEDSLRRQIEAAERAALLICGSDEIQSSLRQRLRWWGVDVIAADTPVRAFMEIMRARHRIACAYVHSPLGSCTATELARFVAHEFDTLRVALLVDEEGGQVMRQAQQGQWRASDHLRVVEPPWTALRLATHMVASENPCADLPPAAGRGRREKRGSHRTDERLWRP